MATMIQEAAPATATELLAGTVAQVDGESLRVRADAGGVYAARRAASCLLDPCCGDSVLVASSVRGGCYVLAVLERAGEQAAALTLPADPVLRAPGGRLQLAARDGIDLITAGEMTLGAGRFGLVTDEGKVTARSLDVAGQRLEVRASLLRLFAERMDSFITRLQQRLGQYLRRVAGSEEIRAEYRDVRVEKVLTQHGRYAIITADKDIKIQGEYQHIG